MAASARKLIENIVEFVEVKTEQIKLKVITQVARMLSGVIALVLVAILAFFFLFFLSFSLAIAINIELQSEFLGYLILSGFYLLVILTILILVKKGILQKGIERLIVKLEEAKYEQEKND